MRMSRDYLSQYYQHELALSYDPSESESLAAMSTTKQALDCSRGYELRD